MATRRGEEIKGNFNVNRLPDMEEE